MHGRADACTDGQPVSQTLSQSVYLLVDQSTEIPTNSRSISIPSLFHHNPLDSLINSSQTPHHSITRYSSCYSFSIISATPNTMLTGWHTDPTVSTQSTIYVQHVVVIIPNNILCVQLIPVCNYISWRCTFSKIQYTDYRWNGEELFGNSGRRIAVVWDMSMCVCNVRRLNNMISTRQIHSDSIVLQDVNVSCNQFYIGVYRGDQCRCWEALWCVGWHMWMVVIPKMKKRVD